MDSAISDQLSVLNQTIQIDSSLLQQLQNNGLLLQDNLVGDVVLSTPLHLDSDSISLHNTQILSRESKDSSEFRCDICNKTYNSKAILKKHRKIHGEEKEFRCNVCNRGFENNAELERHNKVHLGIRPYSCHLCANSFSEEGSLKTHMKR